jgi:hypothetical protein
MKHLITILLSVSCIPLVASCNMNSAVNSNADDYSDTNSVKLRIAIGTKTFNATLYDNATVAAFKKKLPMAINMRDLNANEKYFDLPISLPANASNPGNIKAGDLMLYGSNTLVLFYKPFSTTYSYTPMGRIENVSGLTAALGSGNVTISFSLQ